MPEFNLIKRIEQAFERHGMTAGDGCVLGIGDDAAVLDVPGERQLAVCTDTLVSGVHFHENASARSVGHKSLAVNLSDLAAMGAEPAWFLLALTLPAEDTGWIDAFAAGMAELARSAGALLVGGDTTAGPLSVTVTAAGWLPGGKAITRAGARPGDQVYVSGVTGRAAMALRVLEAGGSVPAECQAALDFPRPRLSLGSALRDVASACIDVSDGLAADLGHILDCSGVGADLVVDRLPESDCFDALTGEARGALQLTGGDDYELCFTVPPGRVARLDGLNSRHGVSLTRIGTIRSETGLSIRRADGERVTLPSPGYEHFNASAEPG